MMQSKQPGSVVSRARLALGVVLAAVWVGACEADDTGLFSNDAPLSPAGGSSGAAGAAGSGGTGSAPPPVSSGGGPSDSDSGLAAGGSSGDGTSMDPEPPEAPPVVAFQYNRCEPFVPCGGSVTGNWVYSAGCIGVGDLGLSLQDDSCEAVSADIEAEVGGTLRFSGSTVQHDGSGSGSGVLRIPTFCTLAIGGCPGLRDLIENDDDACDQTGSDCLCDFVMQETEWTRDTYQISGTTLTLGSGRTFDYCVEGNELTYRETSEDGSPQDSALHVLTRQ
jgi:hypothetical protein